jgi:hypothetical protein
VAVLAEADDSQRVVWMSYLRHAIEGAAAKVDAAAAVAKQAAPGSGVVAVTTLSAGAGGAPGGQRDSGECRVCAPVFSSLSPSHAHAHSRPHMPQPARALGSVPRKGSLFRRRLSPLGQKGEECAP